MNREELFIKKQRENGECQKCYQEQRGAIQSCEIEGFCKFDKVAVKEWEELFKQI